MERTLHPLHFFLFIYNLLIFCYNAAYAYLPVAYVHGIGIGKIPGGEISDKTAKLAMRAVELDGYMRLVVRCCKEADNYIWTWLLEGVTEGVSYGALAARGIPCSKDYYYDRYRKFFWLLDKER